MYEVINNNRLQYKLSGVIPQDFRIWITLTCLPRLIS